MYTVNISRNAKKAIDQLPPNEARRIYVAINNLANDPRPPGCKKLAGSPYWRIRVGNYRVIYEIDDTELTVTVLEVGHRSDIYR